MPNPEKKPGQEALASPENTISAQDFIPTALVVVRATPEEINSILQQTSFPEGNPVVQVSALAKLGTCLRFLGNGERDRVIDHVLASLPRDNDGRRVPGPSLCCLQWLTPPDTKFENLYLREMRKQVWPGLCHRSTERFLEQSDRHLRANKIESNIPLLLPDVGFWTPAPTRDYARQSLASIFNKRLPEFRRALNRQTKADVELKRVITMSIQGWALEIGSGPVTTLLHPKGQI